jgi:hypothetical protein
MRTIRRFLVSTVTLALVLGPTAIATAQEKPQQLLLGTAKGINHGNMDNPLGSAEGWTGVTSAVGESSLLGVTNVEFQNCYSPEDTLTNAYDGIMTLMGEAGDELSGTLSGNCIPDWVTDVGDEWACTMVVEVTGGAGAFEGASGEIHLIGSIINAGVAEDGSFRVHPASMVYEGVIDA